MNREFIRSSWYTGRRILTKSDFLHPVSEGCGSLPALKLNQFHPCCPSFKIKKIAPSCPLVKNEKATKGDCLSPIYQYKKHIIRHFLAEFYHNGI